MSAGAVELFTLPRASVDRWADEVLGIAATLTVLCGDGQGEPTAGQMVARRARQQVAEIVLDMAGHGIIAKDHLANEGERLQLVPNVPAAVLGGLDKLDPLADGFRRVNSAHFAAMVSGGGDDDDDEDLD